MPYFGSATRVGAFAHAAGPTGRPLARVRFTAASAIPSAWVSTSPDRGSPGLAEIKSSGLPADEQIPEAEVHGEDRCAAQLCWSAARRLSLGLGSTCNKIHRNRRVGLLDRGRRHCCVCPSCFPKPGSNAARS